MQAHQDLSLYLQCSRTPRTIDDQSRKGRDSVFICIVCNRITDKLRDLQETEFLATFLGARQKA